jgi:hypothetical protein
LTTAQCSGPCDAPGGTFCPPGATSSQGLACPPGFSCPPGAVGPSLCPLGSYSGPKAPDCSPCGGGYYSASPGLTTLKCSGPCDAGTYCREGQNNTSPRGEVCPVGKYCPLGSADPLLCPEGHYGNTTGLNSSWCSGPCPEGFTCKGGGCRTRHTHRFPHPPRRSPHGVPQPFHPHSPATPRSHSPSSHLPAPVPPAGVTHRLRWARSRIALVRCLDAGSLTLTPSLTCVLPCGPCVWVQPA